MIEKLKILGALLSFLWARRLWWLIPMIVIILLMGMLVIFLGSSPLAPIVYPLF